MSTKDLKHNPEKGIYLIDKPIGITSFDVIRILRNKLNIKKMGHGGTLDPLASGLLVIAVGNATKKLSKIIGFKKSYEAFIRLGVKTDTADSEGSVVEEESVNEFQREDILEVLNSLLGEVEIEVPIYSAIKKAGKPLYQYAREGKDIKPPKRKMKVFKVNLLEYKHPELKVYFEVGSGTYIRSLSEEVGKRLGTVAMMSGLRRLTVGDFSVEDALPPEKILKKKNPSS